MSNLRLDPNGDTLPAATHGRGLWRIRAFRQSMKPVAEGGRDVALRDHPSTPASPSWARYNRREVKNFGGSANAS